MSENKKYYRFLILCNVIYAIVYQGLILLLNYISDYNSNFILLRVLLSYANIYIFLIWNIVFGFLALKRKPKILPPAITVAAVDFLKWVIVDIFYCTNYGGGTFRIGAYFDYLWSDIKSDIIILLLVTMLFAGIKGYTQKQAEEKEKQKALEEKENEKERCPECNSTNIREIDTRFQNASFASNVETKECMECGHRW